MESFLALHKMAVSGGEMEVNTALLALVRLWRACPHWVAAGPASNTEGAEGALLVTVRCSAVSSGAGCSLLAQIADLECTGMTQELVKD